VSLLVDAPARDGFRVLALSGGGYLGLYSAAVLAALEEQAGEPIGRRFDLIAGTSVGGITAAAVAFELPLSHLVRFFFEEGKDIFSARAKPSGTVGRLLDLSRSVLGPKYDNEALRAALTERLGEATFADALHPLLLPAVDVTRSLTKVFKTPHAEASRGDERVRVADAVLAACAAPAYFPSVEIDGALYADGGLFAVAPDQVALHEAEHFMGIDVARVRMLSIGTATVGYQPADADRGAAAACAGDDGRPARCALPAPGRAVAGRGGAGHRHRDAAGGEGAHRAGCADGARDRSQAPEGVLVSHDRTLMKLAVTLGFLWAFAPLVAGAPAPADLHA
jgi:uncharacterized protein